MSLWHNSKIWCWLVVPMGIACLLAVIIAIAIPRLGYEASPVAAADLKADVTTVRNAIALYAAEHNGQLPGPDASEFARALTTYTHESGAAGTADEARFAFRRYLVAIPPCRFGAYSGTPFADDVFVSLETPLRPNTNEPAGWVYNPRTGEFIANTAPSRRSFGRY